MDTYRIACYLSSMPVIFRYRGYRFFIYSNEGDPREPLHVHARKGEAEAKIWLEPNIAVAESFGITGAELRDLLRVAAEHKERIRRCWDDHFEI